MKPSSQARITAETADEHYARFQVDGKISINIGKISNLPTNIVRDNTSFDKTENPA